MVQDIKVKRKYWGNVSEGENIISNDSYVVIVAGDDRDSYGVAGFNRQEANKAENLLNTALKRTIANVVMAGITSPIAQRIAGRNLSSATMGRIYSSIYDIMADGKITKAEVAEDFIGSCTNALDNMATKLGFPTPSSLYDAITPSGKGVISKDFVSKFSEQLGIENKKADQQVSSNKNVLIIKLKLINSDTEDLGIDIPTRKTEKNFNIATSINNQNKVKTIEAVIVNNERKGVYMYQIKNQLQYIRDKKEPINVFINDADVGVNELLDGCLLSGLSFGTQEMNALSCTLSFTEVPDWDVKIDATLDKSLGGSTGGNIKKTAIKKKGKTAVKNKTSNSSVKNKNKTIINPSTVYVKGNTPSSKDAVLSEINRIKNLKGDAFIRETDKLAKNLSSTGVTSYSPRQQYKNVQISGAHVRKLILQGKLTEDSIKFDR